MAGRDAEFRMASDADPRPGGGELRCPRCRGSVDVRRYGKLSPPEAYVDCWRCKVTWAFVIED
jgi:hypothetical protein